MQYLLHWSALGDSSWSLILEPSPSKELRRGSSEFTIIWLVIVQFFGAGGHASNASSPEKSTFSTGITLSWPRSASGGRIPFVLIVSMGDHPAREDKPVRVGGAKRAPVEGTRRAPHGGIVGPPCAF